jgi:hypothetical protein
MESDVLCLNSVRIEAERGLVSLLILFAAPKKSDSILDGIDHCKLTHPVEWVPSKVLIKRGKKHLPDYQEEKVFFIFFIL